MESHLYVVTKKYQAKSIIILIWESSYFSNNLSYKFLFIFFNWWDFYHSSIWINWGERKVIL